MDPSRTLPLLLLLAGCAPDVAAVRAAQRPDTPDGTELPPRFDEGDVVQTFDSASGFFRVHFTTEGAHAVPDRDADGSGVPDHVEEVAALYDEAHAFYTAELGLDAPPTDAPEAEDGGDERFDVYLLDFPSTADGSFRREGCDAAGSCWGYMVQDNDFTGRGYPSASVGNRIVGSHEYFHAVQAGLGLSGSAVASEATATWATEAFDPSLPDFERQVAGYLERPERSLGQDPIGPIDAFSYGAALFFRFLEERYDRGVVVGFVAEAGDADPWLDVVDAILARDHGASFAEAWADHVVWNLYTGSRADPAESYAHGNQYRTVETRPETMPFSDASIRVFPASARIYEAPVGGASDVAVALVGEAADLEGLHVVLAVEADAAIRTLARGAAADGRLRLPTSATDDRVLVAVANGATDGSSRQPGVCFGASADVDRCVTEQSGAPTDAGALPTDGGVIAPDAGPTPEPEPGGGCAAAPVPGPAAPAWALLATILARRRRDRLHRY